MKEKSINELMEERKALLTRTREIIGKAKEEKRAVSAEEREEMEKNELRVKEINLEIESRNDVKPVKAAKAEAGRFSLVRAIRSALGDTPDEFTAGVMQRAAERHAKAGLESAGFVVPAFERRDGEVVNDLQATVATLGKETVPTETMALLEPLYANQVLSSFTLLTGLSSNISIPSMTAGAAGWADEIGDAQESGQKFASKGMKPKRLTCYCPISKQLLIQSNSNIEAIIRADIQKAVMDKLQSTILGDAAGTDNKPAGLFNGATAIASLDFAALVGVEKAVEDANVIATGYIINPAIKAIARVATKAQGQGGFLFDGGQLLGMPTAVTTASSGLLFGDLKEVIVGQWGDIDIVVDPYTRAGKGEILLTINTYWDAILRRSNAVVAKKVTA